MRSIFILPVLVMTASTVLAQTSPSPVTPMPAAPNVTSPAASVAAPTVSPAPIVATPTNELRLTESEAKQWIDKVVYSSDGRNLGEVAAFKREMDGRVTEMHADLGGFMGLGESRVLLSPAQFRVDGDRIVLNMTADQAKALPVIPKT